MNWWTLHSFNAEASVVKKSNIWLSSGKRAHQIDNSLGHLAQNVGDDDEERKGNDARNHGHLEWKRERERNFVHVACQLENKSQNLFLLNAFIVKSNCALRIEKNLDIMSHITRQWHFWATKDLVNSPYKIFRPISLFTKLRHKT